MLTTKKPYPALLAQLVKLSIVPKAYVEKVGDQDFNLKPIGSGPYSCRNWQRGVQVTLEANDTYWRGKPPFRTVVFRAVPDVATRVADLQDRPRRSRRACCRPTRRPRSRASQRINVLAGRRPSASATCSSTRRPARPRT